MELSISKEDFHLKLTRHKVVEAIINDMTNSCLMSKEKDEDCNEVFYAHSFSNNSFDHSNLYYDDDIVNHHMPYNELLDAFDELFVEFNKVVSKNNVLKKQVASLVIELENLKKDANIL